MLIVIIQHPAGDYIPERDVSRCNWDDTVQDIAEGQFDLTRIKEVICTATGVDVLPTLAKQVQDIWADRGEGITDAERDFLERHVSISVANTFRQMEMA